MENVHPLVIALGFIVCMFIAYKVGEQGPKIEDAEKKIKLSEKGEA